MKHALLLACALLALAAAGCRRGDRPPVVHVQPVEVHPYEDGYTAGFELGKTRAAPGADIPEEFEVEPLARDQVNLETDRVRWNRGFVQGYIDGFRKVVTGQN